MSGTAKFATYNACIRMDQVETEFLQSQELQVLVVNAYFKYIVSVFFVRTHGKKVGNCLTTLVSFAPISNLRLSPVKKTLRV